jgi:FAD/FMN-containing dehydrogenase
MESVYPGQGAAEPQQPVVRSRSAFPTLATPAIPNARFLKPGDADYATFLPLHNKRNSLQPAIRIICSSTQAVADSVNWVRGNGLQLALRSGGHCYEGFSQSPGVVIDVRGMGLVTVDTAGETVSVSAGANLGKVYRAVAEKGFAFAAGSCPTVGVPGHTLGGGQGLMGRRFGLTCDNLVSLRVVDAAGAIREIDATHDADLFWAMRGGGGGSFGVATRFQYKIYPIQFVRTFRVAWKFPDTDVGLTRAAQIFDAWQRWAPSAPKAITAIMKVQKGTDGKLALRVIGQTTGTRSELEQQLNAHLIVRTPTTALDIVKRSFISAVETFAGSFDYETIYMKAKSDVVASPLNAAGMRTLFEQIMALPSNNVTALCDPYGGAIAGVAANATAFPHRGSSTYIIQYYSNWGAAGETQTRIDRIRQVYAAMRPFMGNACYVNYCDMDLADYATAYWGLNLPRLKQVKQAVDPRDFFKHGQSVPLA